MSIEWSRCSVRDCLEAEFPGEWGETPRRGASANALVLRSTNLDDEGHIDLGGAEPRLVPGSKLQFKRLHAGDILLEASGGGPGKPVGRTALFRAENNDEPYLASNFFRTLRPDGAVAYPAFLAWRLQHLYASPEIWVFQQQTTGITNLNVRGYLDSQFDVPDLSEQHRIAEVLDTVDEGIRRTELVIAKLMLIRQGLLFDFLTRGVDETGRLRPSPVAAPELYKDGPIGPMPKGWDALPVQLAGSVQLGRQRAPRYQSGPNIRPYLRVANVFDGWIDYSDILSMSFSSIEEKQYRLEIGDILLNEGQSLELVGRSALYEGEPGAYCFQNTLVRFRAGNRCLPRFARAVFKFWLDTGRFMAVAHKTTSVAHLGADRFAQMPFPLPPLSEQVVIAARLEAQEARLQAEHEVEAKLRDIQRGLTDDLLSGRVRVPVPDEVSA